MCTERRSVRAEMPVPDDLVMLIADPAAQVREGPDGWAMLVDREAGRSIALNETALAVWRAIDGRRGEAEIVATVLDHYDDPPPAAGQTVTAVLERLVAEGFAARRIDEKDGEPLFAGPPGPLHSVEVAITARCNARCLYCYHFDNPAGRYDDLQTGEWLGFFAELGRLGIGSITLAGGEPFVRDDILTLVDGAAAAGLRFTVLSNGALITDGIAAHLAATGRCDGVQVSVDGSRPETHDAARGRGSFEGAVRGLRTLAEHGVRRSARITIHRFNVDDLSATVELLVNDLGVAAVGTNGVGYLGSCMLHDQELLLTVAERERTMRTLLALARRYPGRIQALAGPLADARMWSRMEAARRDGAPPFANGGRLTGCGCAWSKLAVLADGSIVVCAMLPHLVIGHVGQDDVEEVWRLSSVLRHHRGRRTRNLAEFEHCRGCPYIPYCTGNCPGPAYTLTGQVDAPSPDACLRDYLAAGGHLVEDPDGEE